MVVGFIPVEEVEIILIASLAIAEEEVKDFFWEEWVEEPVETMPMEVLVVVVVVVVVLVVLAAVADTLVEAVKDILRKAVGEGEDLITQEQISKMTVVMTQLAMVR